MKSAQSAARGATITDITVRNANVYYNK